MAADGFHARGSGSPGHVDETAASQLFGRPGHGPSVVSIRCRHKCEVGQFPAKVFVFYLTEKVFINWQSQVFADSMGYGVAGAENLEGIEPETVRLVFNPLFLNAERCRQAIHCVERCRFILWKALVE